MAGRTTFSVDYASGVAQDLAELRVGEYRVFYDVDDTERLVTVRTIRRKPPHATTEEIL